MDWIREKLSSIGAFLVLAGVVSSLLQLIGYELRMFRALDQHGPAAAWGFRLGCIAVGVVLYLVGPKGVPEGSSSGGQ